MMVLVGINWEHNERSYNNQPTNFSLQTPEVAEYYGWWYYFLIAIDYDFWKKHILFKVG